MSEAGDPALIGRRVAGKFLVEKFLGGGAMGGVYRARDETLERLVALKVMHPEVAIEPTFATRFHREARATSRLDHPNSVRVIEFGEEDDGLLYIAMEYLEGRDLYRVIHDDWPLSDRRISDIMMKALAALAVAHEMGVVHRDLKPENIMVLDRKDDEGNDIVKVCDFGIAKLTERDETLAGGMSGAKLTTQGLVVGTPEYMSPEQARGEKVDARADLYSMGIILYQLLTGRVPFMADGPLAVVLKHVNDTPDPPSKIYPEVHKQLEAVCVRAIAKAREDRYQSARDMRAAIKAAIEGLPPPPETPFHEPPARSTMPPRNTMPLPRPGASTPPSAATRTPSAAPPSGEKRSRAPLVAGLTIGAIAVGGVGIFLATRHDPAKPTPPVSESSTLPVTASTPSASASVISSASVAPSASAIEAKPSHHAAHASSAPAAGSWTSAACRATLGTTRSTNPAYGLGLRGADAVWTACAKAAIKERPAKPLVTSVKVRFHEDRTFRSATCKGCDVGLAQCIATSTSKSVTVTAKGAEPSGDPEFDVPVTFVCD